MSADNGIYVLESTDVAGQKEYRLIEAQAIENITDCPDYKGFNTKTLKRYFGECEVLKSKREAVMLAAKMEEEIMKSEFPVLEYGIQFIRMDFPFPE